MRAPGWAVLLAAWLLLQPGAAAAATLAAVRDPRPAVLVHAVPFDGYRAWGWPDPARPHRTGLFHRLYGFGYRAGRSLFSVPSRPAASLPEAAAQVAQAVREAARHSPDGRVHLIAYSAGALAVRYALDTGQVAPEQVEQLMLLAPLERGSATAELIHRLALRQRALEMLQGHTPPSRPEPHLSPFRSEAEYVAERALRWYLPLYRRYAQELLLAPPSSPLPPEFDGWLRREFPGEAAPMDDPDPPLGLAPLPREGGAPAPGRDLSRAYYEGVAREAARDAYRLLRPLRQVAVEGWAEDVPREGSPLQRLFQFLLRRGLRLLAALAGRWAEMAAREAALEAVRQWLELDPLSDWARLAVREQHGRAVANAYLAAWNRSGGRVPAARLYSAPLPPGIPVEGMGPHDGVVDLPAPVPEPSRVLRGLRAPLHPRVPDHAGTQQWVLERLAAGRAVRDASGLHAKAGEAMDGLRTPRPADGAAPGGSDGRPVPATAREAGPGQLPGAESLVSRATAPEPGGSSAPGASQAADKKAERAKAAEAGTGVLIHVVRRSRLTTDKRPSGQGHARWVWDFGDGTREEVGDPRLVRSVQEHRFAQPGQYRVQAVSYSPSGEPVRVQEWQASVRAPGEVLRFEAVSYGAPEVSLRLEGPAAWIAGRPAQYRIAARIQPPPYGEVAEVRYYPGEQFRVVWHRPGNGFKVIGAVTVRIRYRLPDGTAHHRWFTFTAEREVDVAAPSLGAR